MQVNRITHVCRNALVLASSAALFACSSSSSDSQPSATEARAPLGEPGYRVTSTASLSDLDAETRRTFQEDRAYLRRLTEPGVPISLNYADPRQYRFAQTRLLLSGKSPENSPELFRLMAARRALHLESGYGTGPLPVAKNPPAGRVAMHFLEQITINMTGDTMTASATSTFPGDSYYTYADILIQDGVTWAPLGDIGIVEEYDGGTNAVVETTGDLTLATEENYVVDSYQVDDTEIGPGDSYVYEIIDFGRGIAGTLSVTAPVDLNNDNKIKICLSRQWADCDYDLLGRWEVEMPLAGQVTLVSDYIFDVSKINDLKNGIGYGGYIKLILTDVGGGCDVKAGNSLFTDMAVFWQNTTVSGDNKSLTWNMTGASNSAFFDDGCKQYQDTVKLSMRVLLPVISTQTNKRGGAFMYLTNENVTTADYEFDPMKMTNSCLAEGTMVQMAGGKEVAIESISANSRVYSPYSSMDSSLEVTDTSKGYEEPPMVRIESQNGKSLLMTEMHPVHVVGKGMVAAKDLVQGDTVLTTDGPSQLVKVAREQFAGNVHNLKLGSATEKQSLGEDQTVFYANGVLVGDGQIQSKYESMALHEDGPVIDRLPLRWQKDYANSFGLR
jgi:hypothetical protein